MYGNYNSYFTQPNIDKINNQIAELEKIKNQLQNNQLQPSINQTFQLAPNNQNMLKTVNSIEDVSKELVFNDTPFFNNDMSIMWLKNVKGEIKTYELIEKIEKDKKDVLIDNLLMQIEDLKKEVKKEKSSSTNDIKPIENKKSNNGKPNSKYDGKQ